MGDQPQYSLVCRQRVEKEYAALYSKGIPPNTRLANKMFTVDRSHTIRAAENLRPIAERLNCTMGQLALAWCLKNKNVSTVITGATTVDQVDENLKACEVKAKLTPEVTKEVEDAIGPEYAPKAHQIEKQMSYRLKGLSAGAISKL